MAEHPKTWAEMSAEALREAAVLVLVFGLLDKLVFEHPTSVGWVASVVGVALLSFVLGCVLERARRA